MKSWNLLLLVLIISQFTLELRSQNCAESIPPSLTVFDGQNLLPGDTVCIEAGSKDFLLIQNCHGNASQPIVFINKSGTVLIDTDHFYGIKIAGSSHLKLLGNGAQQTYGIRILRVGNGAGVSIDELSTNIEIGWLEIANTAIGGIYAKTDPDCSFVATRDKFTMYDLRIHNCYLHDIADEGFYIGSSKYTGQYLPDCDTTVFPHFIHGVHIHDNIIERTGWDGIQVASSPVDCKIYNNIIIEDSYAEVPNQMSGIIVGGGSVCDCYNNTIIDGKGDGIDVFGHQTMKIYNNLIIRPGRNYQAGNPNLTRHGIFVGNSPAGEAATMHVLHNTIISPKTTGIRFLNGNTSNNLILNNIVSNPGAYNLVGERAYFDPSPAISLFSIRNNLFTEDLQAIKFMNPLNDDFDVQASSPAVNSGFNAGLNAVSFDLLNRPRPHNQGYDIGAFESQDPFAFIHGNTAWPFEIIIFSNPAIGSLTFQINNFLNHALSYDLLSANGMQVIPKETIRPTEEASTIKTVDVSMLRAGLYILRFETNSIFYTKAVIIINE